MTHSNYDCWFLCHSFCEQDLYQNLKNSVYTINFTYLNIFFIKEIFCYCYLFFDFFDHTLIFFKTNWYANLCIAYDKFLFYIVKFLIYKYF